MLLIGITPLKEKQTTKQRKPLLQLHFFCHIQNYRKVQLKLLSIATRSANHCIYICGCIKKKATSNEENLDTYFDTAGCTNDHLII